MLDILVKLIGQNLLLFCCLRLLIQIQMEFLMNLLFNYGLIRWNGAVVRDEGTHLTTRRHQVLDKSCVFLAGIFKRVIFKIGVDQFCCSQP